MTEEEFFVPQIRFVYECRNCGGEFYSRRRFEGTVAFCPACYCEMQLVFEEPEPTKKNHPLSLQEFEARK